MGVALGSDGWLIVTLVWLIVAITLLDTFTTFGIPSSFRDVLELLVEPILERFVVQSLPRSPRRVHPVHRQRCRAMSRHQEQADGVRSGQGHRRLSSEVGPHCQNQLAQDLAPVLPARVVIPTIPAGVVFSATHRAWLRLTQLDMGHGALAPLLPIVTHAKALGQWLGIAALNSASLGEPRILLILRQEPAMQPQLLIVAVAYTLGARQATAAWGPANNFAHAIFFGLRRRPRALRSSMVRGP